MAAFCVLLLLAIGCKQNPPPTPPADSYVALIDAHPSPPAGWASRTVDVTPRDSHIVWESASGRTAYGVIHFKLPLPVGHDLALWGFLLNMRKNEGDAKIVSKQWDEKAGSLRFVAEGDVHKLRANLFVKMLDGWIVYAGTLQKQEIDSEEIVLAEIAREQTRVGR